MNKNNILQAIIVDDSQQARMLLKLMLKEHFQDVSILAEAETGNEGFDLVKHLSPDLIFLDIEMPEKSGIAMAQQLMDEEIFLPIVFTTAFNEYAIQAFRLSAIDYLLKPISEIELIDAVNRVKKKKEVEDYKKQLQVLNQNLNKSSDDIICIPVQNGYEYYPIKNIEYIEADGSYVKLFLHGQKAKTVSKNLKYFADILLKFQYFFRAHRSFIININYMASFSKTDRGIIVMQSGKKIDLARDRRGDFFDIIQKI
ncbi:MAG: LytTR family DNA-binding domain-containing protein [Bacteroidota bacterium]|nr:LytTR family DNA-binding domain-containing protein [Bacteroidota bacterium]